MARLAVRVGYGSRRNPGTHVTLKKSRWGRLVFLRLLLRVDEPEVREAEIGKVRLERLDLSPMISIE